jgi:hypothetical protein
MRRLPKSQPNAAQPNASSQTNAAQPNASSQTNTMTAPPPVTPGNTNPTAPAPTNGKNLPMLGADLGSIGNMPVAIPLPESGGTPFVGFFSKKSSRAADVIKALGSVSEGFPYYSVSGDYYPLAQCTFQILGEFRYWCVLDDKNDMLRAWLLEQPFGKKVMIGGKRLTVKDAAMAIMLVLPGAAPMPEEMRPAQIALVDLRGTKSPCVFDHLKGMIEAQTPEWAKAHGDLAATVVPRFRVASSFVIKAENSRDGWAYATARAKTEPVNMAQIEAIRAWSIDKELQEEFTHLQEVHTQRIADLKQFATECDKAEAAK